MDFNLTPVLNGLYQRDDAFDFGVKLSDRAAYGTREHVHKNIQVSIPLGDTVIEARWRTREGALRHGTALRGHAMIVPPGQYHAVGWRNRAVFVNFHIGANLPDDKMSRLLAAVAEAGEAHVVRDPFLSGFGENILTLASNKVALDVSMMRMLRLMLIAHIVKAYAPRDLFPEAFTDGTSAMPMDCEPIIDGQSKITVALGHSGQLIKVKKAPELAQWQLRKVINAIDADLRQDRSVQELAGMVNLSKGHFSRAFRASTGLSPRQWIIDRRVKLAIEKLTDSAESLAEISASCGFSEQSHFTRTFSQATGISPGAWRRAHKR